MLAERAWNLLHPGCSITTSFTPTCIPGNISFPGKPGVAEVQRGGFSGHHGAVGLTSLFGPQPCGLLQTVTIGVGGTGTWNPVGPSGTRVEECEAASAPLLRADFRAVLESRANLLLRLFQTASDSSESAAAIDTAAENPVKHRRRWTQAIPGSRPVDCAKHTSYDRW